MGCPHPDAAGRAQTRIPAATLTRLAQERFTSAENGRLIEVAESELTGADPDSYPVRAVKARARPTTSSSASRKTCSPAAPLSAEAQNVWAEARKKNDYALFAPYLKQMLAYAQQMAEAIGYSDHPYDALLVQYEPGMTAQRLQTLFANCAPCPCPCWSASPRRPAAETRLPRARVSHRAAARLCH